MKKYYPFIPIIGIYLCNNEPDIIRNSSPFVFFTSAIVQTVSLVAFGFLVVDFIERFFN
jgi:hypothetical protein